MNQVDGDNSIFVRSKCRMPRLKVQKPRLWTACEYAADNLFGGFQAVCPGETLQFPIPQNPRRRRRLRLEFRYSVIVFRREIQQSFLGEGIGLFREAAAALCLFF